MRAPWDTLVELGSEALGLLREHQWSGRATGREHLVDACPVCGGCKPGEVAPDDRIGHRPECTIDRLLRKEDELDARYRIELAGRDPYLTEAAS